MSKQARAEEPAKQPSTGYRDLKYLFANLHTLFSVRSTLAIDMMTAMPAGALSRRLQDIAAITKRIYAETTSNAVTNLLEQVESEASTHPETWPLWDQQNLREMRRIHSHLSALTPDLYLQSVEVASQGRKRHTQAQAQSWKDIKPYIGHVVDLYRKIGALKQKKFSVSSPYEGLLLGYASDLTLTQMDALYEDLIAPLSVIRDKALEKQNAMKPPVPLEGEFPRGEQMWLNKTVLEVMGFDFNRGTLQVTGISPLAGGSPEDVRILVRCGKEDTFLDSLEDTLYQGARGLYMQNLPMEWVSQPVGNDLGTLMMNAQSMLYETIIGRTPQFFEFVASRAEGVFKQFRNKSFEPENLYRLKKIISPSAKRNEADELTKIFHDLIRYRIERDLINGALDLDDLPERWNEESKKYLGLTPESEIEGPLQNPDWFTGRFGFIPTNTLSHIIAATLHEKLYQDIPNLSEKICYGDLKPVNAWMKEHIHGKGRSVDSLTLVQEATGQKLSAQPLLTHFERRYYSDKR